MRWLFRRREAKGKHAWIYRHKSITGWGVVRCAKCDEWDIY